MLVASFAKKANVDWRSKSVALFVLCFSCFLVSQCNCQPMVEHTLKMPRFDWLCGQIACLQSVAFLLVNALSWKPKRK